MSNNQISIEEINNEILTLFEKQENKPEYLPYFFPKDVEVNSDLLFIGINPSITEQTRGKIKEDNYSIKNIHNQEIINEIKTQDESLRETLPYFNKIQDMVNNNEIEDGVTELKSNVNTFKATFADVELFAKHVGPNVKIKAAGGISSMDDAEKFIELGATRLGTSRIVKIVKNEAGSGY